VLVKSVPWIFIGILVGYILGGVLPKLEFEQREKELEEIIEELEVIRGRTKGTYIPLISETIDEQSESTSKRNARKKAKKEKVEAHPQEEIVVQDEEVYEGEVIYVDDEDGVSDGDLEYNEAEDFKDFVELQQMRAEQSRMALIEQAEFSEEQIEQMDEIFDDLNSNLAEHSDQIWEFMENSKNGLEIEEVELYEFTHKMSGILYESQNELENLIGDQSVDKESKRIYNHIDMEFLLEVIDEDYAQ
jgi:hypothetical protein